LQLWAKVSLPKVKNVAVRFQESCHVLVIVTRFVQYRMHVFGLVKHVKFCLNCDTFCLLSFSSAFLLFLPLKLPCEFKNMMKLHEKLRHDEMSSPLMISTNQNVIYLGNIKCKINESIFFCNKREEKKN
jgi:hypothetical protein